MTMIQFRTVVRRLVLVPACCLAACTGGFDDINKDPYAASKEDMGNDNYIVTSTLSGMQGWVIPLDVNTHQFTDILLGGALGGFTADSNPGHTTRISIFNPTNDWTRVMMNRVVVEVYNAWTKLRTNSDDEVALAVASLVRAAAMHRVTDTYGPIPYSQIGADGALTAPYDSQQEVYNHLFEEIDQAIVTLSAHASETIKASADKVYGGNLARWIRFGNSLKLRIAMRLSYVAPELAETRVREALGNAGGVIEQNADNAAIPAQKNPFRVVMYDYNNGDSRVSADITSYMNGYEDPRREKYFTPSTFTDPSITNGYIGLRSGIGIPSESRQYSNMMVDYTTPLMWINAAEVAFLKAEAALRGWYGSADEARTWYERGIALSFEQWGVEGAESYARSERIPQTYVDPLGKESNTSGTATIPVKWDERGDREINLEQIITQKWIAIYPLGFEAWCEFRRTGYPRLMPATNNRSGGIIPEGGFARRMPYPDEEYRENADHVNAAVNELLGGPDNMATRLWWDCKDQN